MVISPIITRLDTLCTLATTVVQSASIDAALPANLPIIYVAPSTETAEVSRYDNLTAQTVNASFTITIGCSAASDALEAVRAQAFSALLGYVPATDYDAIEYESGDMLDLTKGVIWWRDTYRVRYYIRQS